MRAVEIVREELKRVNLEFKAPLQLRRRLTRLAKDARKRGESAKQVISRILSKPIGENNLLP